jgi:hypothetical protein
MRKDFLTLLKNTSRVTSYRDAVTLSEAIRIYADRFKELFFEHYLNTSLKYDSNLSDNDKSYLDRKLRKTGWDFYIELALPFSRSDNYYPEEARLVKFQQEVARWENRVKAKARVFWNDVRETVDWYTQLRQQINVTTPNVDLESIEGFQTELRGYDPSLASYMPEALEHIKYALKEYRTKAKQRLPLLIQKQLPMVIDFQGSLDEGGRYEGRFIRINATSALGKHPDRLVKTLAHEMGHHLFKTWLSKEVTDFWYALIKGDYGDINLRELMQKWPESMEWSMDFSDSLRNSDPILSLQLDTVWEGYEPGGFSGSTIDKREDFQKLLDKGETRLRVPQTPITGYAGKNPEEAFCETVGMLVAYGPRALHEKIRSWLDVILPGQIKLASGLKVENHGTFELSLTKERVAGRFLASRGEVIRPEGWRSANDVPASWTRPGHLYRGMSEAEFKFIRAKGVIRSDESMSFRGEGTNFSDDARDAESYTNFGSTDPRKTHRPNYLIEVKKDDSFKRWPDGYWKAPEVPKSLVTRAWKMLPEAGAVVALLVSV